MRCNKCWEQHCEDGAAYPCEQCPEQYITDDRDRLALDVWKMLGSGERPALGILALKAIEESLPDLTPAEWLELMDRLALIDNLTTAHRAAREGDGRTDG